MILNYINDIAKKIGCLLPIPIRYERHHTIISVQIHDIFTNIILYIFIFDIKEVTGYVKTYKRDTFPYAFASFVLVVVLMPVEPICLVLCVLLFLLK